MSPNQIKILYINTPIYDYLTASLIEGLNALCLNLRCTEASNYGRKLPDAEFSTFAELADLIIVGSNKDVKFHLLQGVSNPKIVFIDGTDFQSFEVPDNIHFKAVFKRELCRADATICNQFIYPLPFAAEKRYFSPPRKKDILVSFLANMRMNPLRQSIHTRLQLRNQAGVISGSTNERAYTPAAAQPLPVETPGYHELLARSMISVNVPGFGYDCARFWEILAARAMLFSYALDIAIPYGFQDGLNYVTFSTMDEFEEKLEYYISHPELVRSIAANGYEHLCMYHTTKCRAEQFLETALAAVQRPGCCMQFLSQQIQDTQ